MWTQGLVFRMSTFVIACAFAAFPAFISEARPVTYRLHNATYTEGCFELCACPLWFAPMTGKFRLTPISITGTYDTYAVTNIHWAVGGVGTSITGHGTLTRFNEFAALNRLELDLAIGSDVLQHFDSGMVVAGAAWPAINIAVAMNGEPACYDIRLGVSAKPMHSDVNQDGAVDIDDLVLVITNWGECPRDVNPCVGDVTPEPDGDHDVNIDDLIKVITEWD